VKEERKGERGKRGGTREQSGPDQPVPLELEEKRKRGKGTKMQELFPIKILPEKGKGGEKRKKGERKAPAHNA